MRRPLCVVLLSGWLRAGLATVVELKGHNFDAELLESPRLLVQFYAPWCGHCRSLAPEFDKASEAFEGRVVFAKVDATQEEALAERLRVEAYPTLYFIRDGRVEPYTGARDALGISQWVEDALGPALKSITEEALQAAIKMRNVTAYFVARGDERLRQLFGAAAERHRVYGEFFFAFVMPGFEPWIEVHRGIDEVVPLRGKGIYDEAILDTFLTDKLLPPFGEINENNFEGYLAHESEGILWVCLHPETYKEDARKHQAAFIWAADKFRQFFFVFTDTREYEEHIRDELGCNDFPTLVLQIGNLTDPESLRRYKQPWAEEELTGPRITAWVQDILDGKVEESSILDELDDGDYDEEESDVVQASQPEETVTNQEVPAARPQSPGRQEL